MNSLFEKTKLPPAIPSTVINGWVLSQVLVPVAGNLHCLHVSTNMSDSYMDCNKNEYNHTKCTLKPGPKGQPGDTGPPGIQGIACQRGRTSWSKRISGNSGDC